MTQITTGPVQSVTTPNAVDTAEVHLTNEIGMLWETHSQAQTSLNKTRDELKAIRTQLSKKLHELRPYWQGQVVAENGQASFRLRTSLVRPLIASFATMRGRLPPRPGMAPTSRFPSLPTSSCVAIFKVFGHE
jgi:hypothetical protein